MTPEKSWLTLEELREITGYKTKPKIHEWLKANNIHCLINGLGTPLVSRILLNSRLAGVDLTPANQSQTEPPKLNIGKLRSINKKAA